MRPKRGARRQTLATGLVASWLTGCSLVVSTTGLVGAEAPDDSTGVLDASVDGARDGGSGDGPPEAEPDRTPVISAELLTNSGFEDGDAGWSSIGGGSWSGGHSLSHQDIGRGPRSGANVLYYNDGVRSGDHAVYQTVDLAPFSARIDAGQAAIDATGWLIQAEAGFDAVKLEVRFFADAAATQELVALRFSSGWVTPPTWTRYGVTALKIPNARAAQLRFSASENQGFTEQAGSADDFSVRVREL